VSVQVQNCTAVVTTQNVGNVSLAPNSFCVNNNTAVVECNSKRLLPGQFYSVYFSVDLPHLSILTVTINSTFGPDCPSKGRSYTGVYYSCIPTPSTSTSYSASPSSSPSSSPTISNSFAAPTSTPVSATPTPSSIEAQLTSSSRPPTSSNSNTPHITKKADSTPSPPLRERICVACKV